MATEQRLRQIVDAHVLLCASPLMDDLMGYAVDHPDKSALELDEIYQERRCPNCNSVNIVDGEDYANHNHDKLTKEQQEEYTNSYWACSDCGEHGDDDDELYREVLEYWFVDSVLARSLKEHGELIIECCSMYYIWGRTCSGQSIDADLVIEQIADEWDNYLEDLKKGKN